MKSTFNENMNRHEYEFTNNQGEKVIIWVTRIENSRKFKNCIVNTWVKGKYIDKIEIEFDCELEANNENYAKILEEIERITNQ